MLVKKVLYGLLAKRVGVLVWAQDNLSLCVGLDFVRELTEQRIGDDLAPPFLARVVVVGMGGRLLVYRGEGKRV